VSWHGLARSRIRYPLLARRSPLFTRFRPSVPDEVLATTGLGGSARQMSASVFHPGSGRPDCVAGHVGLELRNVVANYLFESPPDLQEYSGILAIRVMRRCTASRLDTPLVHCCPPISAASVLSEKYRVHQSLLFRFRCSRSVKACSSCGVWMLAGITFQS
jgi:hypothetical protein